MLGNLGHQRHRGAHDVRRLRGDVHGELARGPVVIGHRTACLDRARVRPRIVQVDLGNHVGLGEGTLGRLLVADLPIEHDVVVLADLVVTNDRRIGFHRLLGVDDRRKRLIVDHDRLDTVTGNVGVVGNNRRDLLALETHLVGRQHGLSVVAERRHPRQVACRHHLARHHHAHTGDRIRGTGVDALDAGVRHRAAQHLHVQHARQCDIVDVVALATDEPVVLDTATARTEATNLDLV